MKKKPKQPPAYKLAKELQKAVGALLRRSGFIRRGGQWVAAN